eukprot:1583380-Pyramimonas_sp.AAC.1
MNSLAFSWIYLGASHEIRHGPPERGLPGSAMVVELCHGLPDSQFVPLRNGLRQLFFRGLPHPRGAPQAAPCIAHTAAEHEQG